MRTLKPKGQPLTPNQLLEFATIRQSDVDEMVKRSRPHEKFFINATVKADGRRQKAEGKYLRRLK